MHVAKKKKTGLAVKRAISLPGDVDVSVCALSQAEGKSYSSMVCEAVRFYLKGREDLEMEKAYRSYYSDSRLGAESESLAAELFAASGGGQEGPKGSDDAADQR
jgi:hypothetical protein